MAAHNQGEKTEKPEKQVKNLLCNLSVLVVAVPNARGNDGAATDTVVPVVRRWVMGSTSSSWCVAEQPPLLVFSGCTKVPTALQHTMASTRWF